MIKLSTKFVHLIFCTSTLQVRVKYTKWMNLIMSWFWILFWKGNIFSPYPIDGLYRSIYQDNNIAWNFERFFSKKVRIREKKATYLYKSKEQDVGGGRPHVSPWGIPSTTAYHRYPRAAPQSLALEHFLAEDVFHCSVAVRVVSFVLFFSPLSPIIIDRYYRHTAHQRSSRSAHQHRISTGPCPPRGGTILFSAAPNTEHSLTLCITGEFARV